MKKTQTNKKTTPLQIDQKRASAVVCVTENVELVEGLVDLSAFTQ